MFSLALVIVQFFQFCDFSLNKCCKIISGNHATTWWQLLAADFPSYIETSLCVAVLPEESRQLILSLSLAFQLQHFFNVNAPLTVLTFVGSFLVRFHTAFLQSVCFPWRFKIAFKTPVRFQRMSRNVMQKRTMKSQV